MPVWDMIWSFRKSNTTAAMALRAACSRIIIKDITHTVVQYLLGLITMARNRTLVPSGFLLSHNLQKRAYGPIIDRHTDNSPLHLGSMR